MKVDAGKSALVADDCTICMDGFNEDTQAAKLNCGHVFHSACIIAWIDHGKDKCPNCKQLINPNANANAEGNGEGNGDGAGENEGGEDDALINKGPVRRPRK